MSSIDEIIQKSNQKVIHWAGYICGIINEDECTKPVDDRTNITLAQLLEN